MPKRSNGFDKDRARAVAAGKKSSRALPPEVKELRARRQLDLEATIYKYINCSLEELKNQISQPQKPAIDILVIKCMIKAIEKGDFDWIEPMLARSIGKPTEKIELEANVTTQTLHDMVMMEIENGDK